MTTAAALPPPYQESCGWARARQSESLPNKRRNDPWRLPDAANTSLDQYLREWFGGQNAVGPDQLGLRRDAISPAEIAKSP